MSGDNKIAALRRSLSSVIYGKEEVIDLLLVAFFSAGNILMEDVPGVGKTTLAKALAKSIDGDFTRVQFTPDLLPSDILGSSIYNPKDAVFYFRKGPVFANILLADEINRASPRTQSALLEAMNEKQVTIEGTTYKLPEPFMVIATQNPVEYQGTYPLPEAQLDRFAMQISLGYPDENYEMDILYSRSTSDPINKIVPVMTCEDTIDIQQKICTVNIEKSVAKYALEIIRATREDSDIMLGASPRAFLNLCGCAKTHAYLHDRTYVIPEDIKSIAVPVLAHRIILDNKAKYSGIKKTSVIQKILDSVSVPI